MAEVIGIKFREDGRVYSFEANGITLAEGDRAIVETSRGIECGTVAKSNFIQDDAEISKPLKPVLRAATEDDLKRVAQNKEKEKRAFSVCEQKIAARKLDMKLVDAEVSFDGSKTVFCFTADGRVDFRELVKDLASALHTRIELRQIGVRDEAKMLGGLGICGQPLCCSRFLDDFQPVSIKMAKEQGLSLNPVKISGMCGRLMCCLKYEHEAYEYLIGLTPKVGSQVITSEGRGVVTDVNLLTGMLSVRVGDESAAPIKVHRDDVKPIRKHFGKCAPEGAAAAKSSSESEDRDEE